MGGSELINKKHILVTVIVGTLAKCLFKPLDLRLNVGNVGECLISFFRNGRIILQFHNLRKIADSDVIRYRNST